MKIVWTDPAVEDLRELYSYIARDSEVYASGFVERIILAAERLLDYPNLGRTVPEAMPTVFGSLFINDIASFIASGSNMLKSLRDSWSQGPRRDGSRSVGDRLNCG